MDIQEQIKDLTEKFSNLFEVEGLGEPPTDVPPSQNKLKKDVKTKNGKVELVSVEDELFPNEGNKKEQFNQKVIGVINDMIQGTATLDDLMNIVRQKQSKPVKEGFEGAVELLEEIIHELKDSTIENALRKRSDAIEKSTMGFYFPSKESVDKFGKLKELADKRAARQGKKLEEIGDAYGYTYKHKPVKEGFEGAIEILEQLLAEADHHANEKNPVVKITDKNYGVASGKRLSGPFNKNHVGQYIVYNKDTDASYLVTPDNWKKSKIKKDLEAQGKFYEALELLEEIINEVSDELAKKASEESHNRYWTARTKHDSLKKMIKDNKKTGFFTDDELKDLKKDYKEVQKNLKKAEFVSTRDNKNQFNRDMRLGGRPVKEGFEGAIELLEEIINEVSMKKWVEAAKNSLPKRQEDAIKAEEKEFKNLDDDERIRKAVTGNIGKEARKASDRATHAELVSLIKTKGKSANKAIGAAKKVADKRRQEFRENSNAQNISKNMRREIKADALAGADPVKSRANESFEGAIELLEEIINEVSSTTMRNALHAHNERKRELEDRANKRIGEIFKKNGIKGNTYGATTPEDRERAIRTEKEIQNDSEMKNIQKEQEKRARKNKLYVDALNKIHRAKLAEAQELLEEVISEVSDATVERAVTHANSKLMNSLFTGGGTNQKDIDKYKSIKKLAELRAKRTGRKLKADVDAGLYKHVKEAQEIVEATIGKLSTSVDNSIEKRQQDAQKAQEKVKENPSETNKAEALKAMKKYRHAQDLKMLRLPKNSGVRANKLFDAAKRSLAERKKSSTARHNRAWNVADANPVKEAIELMETIINEVSVGALARAAENNFDKRRKEHAEAEKGLKKAYNSYEKQSKEHPEDEPALYHALSKLSTTARKAGEKADHNNDLVNLKLPKNSKVSANKLFKAADKTCDKRQEEVDKALDKGKGRGDKEFQSPYKKYSRAIDMVIADPVKARANASEGFEGAMELLNKILGESKTEEEVKSIAKRVLPQREAKAKEAEKKFRNITQKMTPYNMVDGKMSNNQQSNLSKAIDDVNRAYSKVNKAKDISLGNYYKNSRNAKPIKHDPFKITYSNILCNLEETQKLIEGLLVKDGRGDLLDDMSKLITGKTVMGNLQHGLTKMSKGVTKSIKSKLKAKGN